MDRRHLTEIATLLLACCVLIVKCELDDRKSLRYLYRTTPYLPQPETMLNKVTLTQKGYIQFLRYMVDVPVIDEFTFCIWTKSSNFTYSHPLLSYSKHEHDRLIRAWISPHGKTINLEILEAEIFSTPVDLVEDHWYHICQSWESHTGIWMLFINGKLRESGINIQMRGISIPDQGDIVVGQEYTDFEKGLDDGIEGDIFGFNMVMSSASSGGDKHLAEFPHQNELLAAQRRQTQLQASPYLSNQKQPLSIHEVQTIPYHAYYDYQTVPKFEKEDDVPEVLSYFTINNNRNPKGFMDFGKSFLNMFFGEEEKVKSNVHHVYSPKNRHFYRAPSKRISSSRFNKYSATPLKTLGMVLVELGYSNCALGQGSPVHDKRVLVSWTKTPVRVFGGALLKRVPPFCHKILPV